MFQHHKAAIAAAVLLVAGLTVHAQQISGLQKPPKITQGAIVKPSTSPGRFRPAELPLTLTPRTPIHPSAAFFGQAQFDLTEDQIRVFGNETGNHVGIKVMLASANRPVTVEFEITGKATGEHRIMLQIGGTAKKPDGGTEMKPLNTTTVSVHGLRQKLTITGTPTSDGWLSASIAPSSAGTAFELVSVTVRRG